MFITELENHLKKFNTSPILFIGSGFSRRYINTPTWEDLLKNICDTFKLSKPYEYYKSTANSEYPEIASLIGSEFNEQWWNSDIYSESRSKFQMNATNRYSPLKYEVSKLISSNYTNNKLYENELRLLKKANIDGIITTNWDCLLEDIFPDFKVFIGQEELIFSDLYNVGEIYKIHGSILDPNSLILTSDDYNLFHERNSYLAAKLLTFFIENPIVFIGYSLQDQNIQNILKSILKCITKDKADKLKDRLIFCQWSEKATSSILTDSTLFLTDSTLPIKLINLNNFDELFTVLANGKKKMPVKVLRKMKGMIYDFVKSNNSKEKIFVTDRIEDIEDIHNAEFVWGVGLRNRLAEVGIKGIEIKEIHSDVILDNNNWDPLFISKLALTTFFKNCRYIPYFKYLRNASLLDDCGMLNLDSDIEEFSPSFIQTVNSVKIEDFYPVNNYLKRKEDINSNKSFFDLKEKLNNNIDHIILFTPLLDSNKINLEDLRCFIAENLDRLTNPAKATHFRKLICLYDFLKYKLLKEDKL